MTEAINSTRPGRWWWLAFWAVAAILLTAGSVAAGTGLNSTIYSAKSFVERYLNLLSDGDVVTALTMPGVIPSDAEKNRLGVPENISTALLRPDLVISQPSDIKVTEDITNADGSHQINVSYQLDGSENETTFKVSKQPPLYGVINQWAFQQTPLAVLTVSVEHAATFTVGNLTLDTRVTKSKPDQTAFNQSAPYLALAPAMYSMSHTSALLKAPATTIKTSVGSRSTVVLSALPNETFKSRAQKTLDEYLNKCAAQQVLLPADCPFGINISNRVIGYPSWKIAAYPTVELNPGDGSFDMPPTIGAAEISVKVQSLYDGSFDNRVVSQAFNMSLKATIQPDGSIAIAFKY